MSLLLIGFVLAPGLSFAQEVDIDPISLDTECVTIVNNLRYKDRDINKNGEVSTLQDFLQARNYLNNEPTGYFGLMTQKAVKSFQNANGISPSGYVGLITREKIKNLTCNGISISDPTLTLLYPAGGETFREGQRVRVKWTSNGIDQSEKITARINWVGTKNGFGYGTQNDLNLGVNDGEEYITIPSKAYSSNPQMDSVSFASLGSANLSIIAPNVLIWPKNINCLNNSVCMPSPTRPESSTKIPFRIISSENGTKPVISGVSGPQSLNVNQTGTWTVNAYNPNGLSLSYSVRWGDENYLSATNMPQEVMKLTQSATFTHSYGEAGTYVPVFTVTGDSGVRCITYPCPSSESVNTSLSVNVLPNYWY